MIITRGFGNLIVTRGFGSTTVGFGKVTRFDLHIDKQIDFEVEL